MLVSSVDGVGTKLKLAFAMDRHDTIGEDLVKPLRERHRGVGRRAAVLPGLPQDRQTGTPCLTEILRIRPGCSANRCSLIGGETAQMPGFYQKGEYDVSGTIVGLWKGTMLNGQKTVRVGDVVIGIGSSGLHTNGYSLAGKSSSSS